MYKKHIKDLTPFRRVLYKCIGVVLFVLYMIVLCLKFIAEVCAATGLFVLLSFKIFTIFVKRK
jgi:hypothetical protein